MVQPTEKHAIEFRDYDGSPLYIAENVRAIHGSGTVSGCRIFFDNDDDRDDCLTTLKEREGSITGFYGFHSVDQDDFPSFAEYGYGSNLILFCA